MNPPAINTAAIEAIVAGDIDEIEDAQLLDAATLIVRSLREEVAIERTLRMRLHADLLSLISIVQTVEHYLAPGEVRQVTAIEGRWVKEGGQ